MSGTFSLVTGATGLLGGHIAERLVASGRRVRAVVRPNSQTAYLQSLGVELVVGDLTSPEDCARAVAGARHVFHSAAKVGDWGDWNEFQVGCLDATRTLAAEAARARVERFVHVSSTSAYGHPKEGGPPIDETAPLGQNLWPLWDYYTISKVECERILLRLQDEMGLRLSIIRPSWLYGERDRTTMPRLVRRLRSKGIPLIGPGDNPLSAIYAGYVADAALLAAESDRALGEAYNVTHQGAITQREYFTLLSDLCGGRPPTRRLPYGLVFAAALGFEAVAKARRSKTPPLITRYATWLMGRYVSYSTEKAERELGWRPGSGYRDSLKRTLSWFFANES